MALTVAPVLNCQDVFTEIAHLQMAKMSHTLAIAMDHGKELFAIFVSYYSFLSFVFEQERKNNK